MTTVTLLPSAAAEPVVNPSKPGRRPKCVASLQKARLDRALSAYRDGQSEGAAAPALRPAVVPGKFNYPKSMLLQAYFCRGGTGIWHAPRLHLGMLISNQFLSPLGALLDQLEQEGHDVGGARAEWLAFRELAAGIERQARVISQLADDLHRDGAEGAQAFVASGRDGI